MNQHLPQVSYIYFIRDCGLDLFKIGLSADPRKRLSQLQVGSPTRVELIRVLEGDDRAEKWLHKKFSKHHVRGEWFSFTEEMLTIQLPWFAEKPRKAEPTGSRDVGQYLRNAHSLGLLTPREIAEWESLGVKFAHGEAA